MKKAIFHLLALALVTSTGSLLADEVTLSNGDKVSGEIINTDGGKITVKTEFMGEVQIDRAGIASIRADAPLNVTLESGETIVGTIDTKGDELQVKKDDQSEMALGLESFGAIRNDESQAAWEREQQRLNNPGWLDFWSVAADLGLAAARGNADTTTITSGALIERVTGFDKTTLTFGQIYSTQSTTLPAGKTANALTGSAAYERDINKKLFVYTAATFDYDEFQNLDLRSVLGGGLGAHLIKNDRTTWDAGVGGNWNREKFSTGLVRNSAELNIFERSDHQITSVLKLYQSFTIFPNLSESGEYRFRANVGGEVKLNSHLALTFSALNRYMSNPLAGNKKNDLLFSTGVQFTWDQK